MTSHNKKCFFISTLFLFLGAYCFYFFESKPKEIEYKKRTEEMVKKYNDVLRVLVIQDSILKIERNNREKELKSRDSMTLKATSHLETIDSLTRIKISKKDLNEAEKWLDSKNNPTY